MATVDNQAEAVVVDFTEHRDATDATEAGARRSFPFLWLRDNCRCVECAHPHNRNRLLLVCDLRADVNPLHQQVSGCSVLCDVTDVCLLQVEDGELRVSWSDGHDSVYPLHFLWPRRFDDDNMRSMIDDVALPVRLWEASDMRDNIPTFNFKQMMLSDGVLLQWLVALERDGIALISDAPRQPGVLDQISDRVGYLKTTFYG